MTQSARPARGGEHWPPRLPCRIILGTPPQVVAPCNPCCRTGIPIRPKRDRTRWRWRDWPPSGGDKSFGGVVVVALTTFPLATAGAILAFALGVGRPSNGLRRPASTLQRPPHRSEA